MIITTAIIHKHRWLATMNYLLIIGSLGNWRVDPVDPVDGRDWDQSPEVWRVLMAGGALLVTALLLPLWRLPSNEQRKSQRVLSEWGNLSSSLRFYGLVSSKNLGDMGSLRDFHKFGLEKTRWHHLLLQAHFGTQKGNRATICCIASGETVRPQPKTGRPQFRTPGCVLFERVAYGDRRPQAKGPSDSSDSGFIWDSGMFGSLRACNMLHASLNSSHASLLAGRPDIFFLLNFRLGIG